MAVGTSVRLSPIFDQTELRVHITSAQGWRHYVYVLCYPDGTPFYVGKGVGDRVFFHEAEARNIPILSHKLNTIRAIHGRGQRVGYVLDAFFAAEVDALARERQLILQIGRHDLQRGPLTNQTNGGEGASDPSPESRARRAATLGGQADDPDRRAINEFFRGLDSQHDSISIKPVGAHKLFPLTPHPSPRRPTPRMAQTILVSALAQGIQLRPGSRISRQFAMSGTTCVIENGVGRDMSKAGLITLQAGAAPPNQEVLALTPLGFSYVVETFGPARLVDFGVLDPEFDAV